MYIYTHTHMENVRYIGEILGGFAFRHSIFLNYAKVAERGGFSNFLSFLLFLPFFSCFFFPFIFDDR